MKLSDFSELLGCLLANGYKHPKLLGEDRIACISRLLYTHAIIVATYETFKTGYDDRWCYHTFEAAKEALDNWDGAGEPEGWHRHPSSGRRRENGVPATEYVNP